MLYNGHNSLPYNPMTPSATHILTVFRANPQIELNAYSRLLRETLSPMEVGRAIQELRELGLLRATEELGTANDLACNHVLAEQPAITFLNMSGDVTITWDKQNEADMLALIQKKMDEGYAFFLVKPRFFGLLGTKKTPLKSAKDAQGVGSVSAEDRLVGHAVSRICDAEVSSALQKQKARLVGSSQSSGPLETTRRAASAAEVLTRQAVAVRPVVGG